MYVLHAFCYEWLKISVNLLYVCLCSSGKGGKKVQKKRRQINVSGGGGGGGGNMGGGANIMVQLNSNMYLYL